MNITAGTSDAKNHAAIRRALNLLREGLGPYLLDAYRDIYGAKWQTEFVDVARSFKKLDFSSDEALFTSLDTQGWLDLILKRREVFTKRLGRATVAHADELLEVRNRLAHDHDFSLEEVRRTYDTVSLLMRTVGAEDLAWEASRILAGMPPISDEAIMESGEFSFQVIHQMRLLDRRISELTAEQFRIIEWLRAHRRAAVSGCAGSGKTLVAIEKAIRLDRACLSTLVLCHNPFLADHLRYLAAGTRIAVFDFAEWIALLLGKQMKSGPDWIHYVEPTEQELTEALDSLAETKDRYDAVIVDEGQDFRDTWWLLVEQALLSPATGILYVFHDDNQALLPQRSKYPMAEAPFSMSRNCRNAGPIFALVRQLHPQAPEPSLFLEDAGIVRFTPFSGNDDLTAVSVAIQDAARFLDLNDLVVLTNEPLSPSESRINGLQVTLFPPYRWQDVVLRCLQSIGRHFVIRSRDPAAPRKKLNLPTLSEGATPSVADIRAVTSFTKSFLVDSHPSIGISWKVSPDGLSLSGIDRPLAALGFFASEKWVDGLPSPLQVVVTSDSKNAQGPHVRLWTTVNFKGLESRGVVLFLRKAQHDFNAHLYVGLSRARTYLNVVAEASVISTLRSTQGA